MTHTEELKPCPFCGNPKPTLIHTNNQAWWVRCGREDDSEHYCGADAPSGKTPELGAIYWNNRTPFESTPEPEGMERDRLAEQQRWVPVELPPVPLVKSQEARYYGPYLTLWDSGVMRVELFCNSDISPYFHGEHEAGVKAKVTHWMPLPPQPSEVKQ